MRIAELEIVQSELDADEVQCKIVRGEFAIVWRAFRTSIQTSEQVLHKTLRPLNLLIYAGLLRDDGGLLLAAWDE